MDHGEKGLEAGQLDVEDLGSELWQLIRSQYPPEGLHEVVSITSSPCRREQLREDLTWTIARFSTSSSASHRSLAASLITSCILSCLARLTGRGAETAAIGVGTG